MPLLEKPRPLPLARVYFFAGILQENSLAHVNLSCRFVCLGPVDQPVLVGWRVMVKMVMADGDNLCFVGGFGDSLTKLGYRFEFGGVRRQAETVWAQRDSGVQEHGDVRRLD